MYFFGQRTSETLSGTIKGRTSPKYIWNPSLPFQRWISLQQLGSALASSQFEWSVKKTHMNYKSKNNYRNSNIFLYLDNMSNLILNVVMQTKHSSQDLIENPAFV